MLENQRGMVPTIKCRSSRPRLVGANAAGRRARSSKGLRRWGASENTERTAAGS